MKNQTWPLFLVGEKQRALDRLWFQGLRNEPPKPMFGIKNAKLDESWHVEVRLMHCRTVAEWLGERSRLALFAMQEYVEADPSKLGGIVVFRGTRFSVPQFIGELADSDAVADIADNFDMTEADLRGFLHALAVFLNKPVSNADSAT